MKKILVLLTVLQTLGYSQVLDCDKADTTYDLMDCQKIEIIKTEKFLNKYWKASIERYKDNKEVVSLMEKSQEAWMAHKKAHCNAIYQMWIDGTIRGLMYGSCVLDMTEKRTHEIWETYLTYMDSAPPLLKEPK